MKEVLIVGVEGGVLNVKLFGDIDAGNAEEFLGEILSAYEAQPCHITFDCAGLEFIDSTTLGTFVKITKRLKADGNVVRLINTQAKIKKLFVICALDQLMEIA